MIYNPLGAAFFFLAALIAGLLGLLLGRRASFESLFFFVATGVLVIVLDLWYRLTRGDCSFLHPRRGGQILFIPVWLLGALLIVLNLFDALVIKAHVSAKDSVSQKPSSYLSPFAYSPRPSYRSLKLEMISGVGSNRIATVNGEPFAQGESRALTIDSAKRVIQCTEIRNQSVVLTLFGDSRPLELRMGEPLAFNRR